MQRFQLGGDSISDDLFEEAEKLMDCKPVALAIGLTTDAGPGGVEKLAARCRELTKILSIPVCNASEADYLALRTLSARKIAVVTPFNAEIDQHVKTNTEEAGFIVNAIKGTEAPSLPEICETPIDDIREVFREVAQSDCDAILQVGTALPVVSMIASLEEELGKPIVACNAALYWQTLRAAGIHDKISGYGRLFMDF